MAAQHDRWSGDGERLVVAYANDGEMVIAVARLALIILFLFRYVFDRHPGFGDSAPHFAQRIVAHLVGIAFSIWIVRYARTRRLGLGAHLSLTATDAVLCFLSLRTNILWADAWAGLLRMPDVAFLAVLIFASGLRLHQSAVVLALVLNVTSLILLVRIDRAVHGARLTYGMNDVQIIALQLAAAGAAAATSVWAARRALRQLAAESERVARGRRYLHEVLREHHDVRTLLSTARLQLDFLRRDRDRDDGAPRVAAVERAVVEIGEVLDDIKRRTFAELAVADDIAEVDPGPLVDSALAVARDRFPAATIVASLPEALPRVLIFGGERALAHVIVNVLVNACEGDGTRHAARVAVQVSPEPAGRARRVVFEIVDDGPGFRPDLLQGSLKGGLSTKASGTGLGLSLIAGIVEASGGTIRLENAAPAGARVLLSLRAVGTTTATR
jgi:signal transduction histidine kinase